MNEAKKNIWKPIAIIALVIAMALVVQLWEFLSGVWKEAKFYNEH